MDNEEKRKEVPVALLHDHSDWNENEERNRMEWTREPKEMEIRERSKIK